MKAFKYLKSLAIFMCMISAFTLTSQKNTAPVNIELKIPRIKATDLNNNLDIYVHSKLKEFFVGHQNIFNVIDRSDISQIEEERAIHKGKKNDNMQSSAMLGTQIIIESTLKNFKQKLDSACMVTQTDKAAVGKVKFVDTKISNCSLYILTYSFDMEMSAIDVETGTVIETITLNIGSEGSAPYNYGTKDIDALKKECVSRLSPCFNQVLRESSLFITKVNIPILGFFNVNEKKLEAKELFVLGSYPWNLPFNLKMDVITIEDEKLGEEIIQRQKVIGDGRFDKSISGQFVLDLSNGEKEIYSKLIAKEKLYTRIGKNMLSKSCVNPLVKKRL